MYGNVFLLMILLIRRFAPLAVVGKFLSCYVLVWIDGYRL